MRDVDAVEHHRQLRGLELRAERALVKRRQTESALLEPLVEDDETAVVPGQHLHPVAPSRDEDEEVAGVDVFLPARAHQRGKAVDAVA